MITCIQMEKQNRNKNFKYSGTLEEYQLQGQRRPVMQYETDGYSQYQNYLYKRALYGLNALSQDELATMCSKKRQRIINVHKKGQQVLNLLKQQVTIQYTNLLFKRLFPDSPITDLLLSNTETDEKFKNSLTFKDLNISKEHIITAFIEQGILPKNFLNLESNPNQLPRLKNQ